MASLINESANEKPLVNGYCGSSSGNKPKFKKRNVSATRRFPPNCGPNAEPISPEALLDVIVSIDGGHSNSVQTEIGVEVLARGLEENPSTACGLETSGGDNDFQENMVVQNLDPVAVDMENHGIESKSMIETGLCEAKKSPDGSENDGLGLPLNLVDVSVLHDDTTDVLESNTVKTESRVDEVDSTKSTSAMEVEIHEGVGSPSFLEQSVSINELVGDAVVMVMGSIDSEVEQKALDVKPLCFEFPTEMEGSNMDQENVVSRKDADGMSISQDKVEPYSEIGVVAVGEIPVTDKTIPNPKEKYRRRKFSASRAFPQHCGKNAPPLTEEERSKIFYGTESLVGSNMEYLQHELQSSKKALESGKSNKILSATVGGSFVEEMGSGVKELEGNLTDIAIIDDTNGIVGKETFDAPGTSNEANPSHKILSSGPDHELVIVNALMAAPNCPWLHEKENVTSDGRKIEGRVDTRKSTSLQKGKVVAKKTNPRTELSKGSFLKKQKHSLSAQKDAVGTSHARVVRDEGNSGEAEEGKEEDSLTVRKNSITVNFPPFGASSSHSDARNKVREALRIYQTICRKLLQGEEAKTEKSEKGKRIDLEASKILKEKGVEVNADKNPVGSVPGVEVGDEFLYRVELAIVGIHRLYQSGIDYVKQNGMIIATSIVASGAYSDGWDNADVLIYSGQGGNVIGKKKQPEDQKLERGNLALANSASTKNAVRVVRGSKEPKASDSQDSSKSKSVVTYVYDGLYTVEKYWQETGPHGKLVYMFELRRIPGQAELAGKELKNAKREKTREGVCVADISKGKELMPICAVNTIDDEKPPAFTYIRHMKYPSDLHLSPPQGCNCATRCSEFRRCPCILRNGKELPYNRNGAIVETKPIVYECGPSCKCPHTCYNRVSQHGIKIQLEIFKTENRGWGVRSLASITSGSFICEYTGELLEDKEAEQRTGSDEYLFDIGKNPSSLSLDEKEEDDNASVEEGGYTVDAAVYGNVGRFINHSCSPNLYAQDVLYDHDDKRMPHVMFFAAENIPPFHELTYDYNYNLNQVRDSNGNIKMKSCYCGSADCSGRMY